MKQKLKYLFILLCLIIPFGMAIGACSLFGNGNNQQTHVNTKIELTRNRIQYSGAGCYYDGTEKTLDISKLTIQCNGTKVDNSYFTFSYQNNVNVGEDAVLIITCKENNPIFTGVFEYKFNIYKGHGEANSITELKEMVESENYYRVDIACDLTVPVEETITVAEGTSLRLYQDYKKITNYGTIIVNGTINVSSGYTELINIGTLQNNNQISVAYNSKLFTGNYCGDGEITNWGDVYCDDMLVSNIVNKADSTFPSQVGQGHIRTDLSYTTITVDGVIDGKAEFVYNQESFMATVNVNGVEFKHEIDGLRVFSNNTYPNKNAKVTIYAYLDSTKYYGSTEYAFEIIKGQATVSTYDELLQAQTRECYNRYVLTSAITIPNDCTFTIGEDETLTGSNIAINGVLVNNGNLLAQLNVLGSLTNNGTIQAQSIMCNIAASVGNNLNGIINVTNFTINGELNNSGSLNISGQSTAKQLKLNNSGVITNTGNLTLLTEFSSYINTGIITNTGTIYGYVDNELSGVSNVVYRKYLTSSHDEYVSNKNKYAYVSLDETTFYYLSNTDQYPNVVVTYNNGGSDDTLTLYLAIFGNQTNSMTVYDDYDKTHSTNDYLIGINYISKYADDTLLKSAGTLQLKIGTNSNNKDFVLKSEDRLTNILLDYSIERVQKNVSSSSDLMYLLTNGKESLNQGNYRVISLNTNIDLYNYSNKVLILQNYCTLYIGAHELSFKNTYVGYGNYFVNYGKIQGTSSSLLRLKNSGTSAVTSILSYGVIEDVGKILLESDKCKLVVENENGIVKTNNSVNPKIYTFVSSNYGLINSSNVGENVDIYTRKSLTQIKEDNLLQIEYTSTPYVKNSNRRPAITLNGNPLDSNIFATPVYSNNLNAGEASVTVSTIDEFDNNYYGSVTFLFTIERIEQTIIGLSQDMIDSRNYSKFILTQDITLPSNISLGDYGLIVDMGVYDFVNSGTNNYKVTCTQSSKLWVSINNVERYVKYCNVADKMTFINSISRPGGNSTIKTLRLSSSYTSSGDSSDPSRMILGGHYNHLEIDINGYNFGYDTTFQFDNSYSGDYTIIITSSREGGTMGGASADKYAININDPGTNSSLNLTISNLTIYNFVAPYKPKATITINCTNAIFNATENNWYAFKLYNSTYDVYCISTETTIIYRESGITKLTVNVDNKDNIINGSGRYNGIFIGPENEKT